MDIKNLSNYVMYDTETSGLDFISDRIVEHGCLRVENNEIVDSLRILVKQNIYLSQFVSDIHGITNEVMNRDGQDPKESCQKVMSFLGDLPVVGLNNIPFDFPMLESECRRHGLDKPKVENWFDVGLLHKGIHMGNLWNGKEPFFRYAFRIKEIRAKGVKYNLNHLVKTYEVENLRDSSGGLHGAVIDIKMTKHVLDAMKKKFFA